VWISLERVNRGNSAKQGASQAPLFHLPHAEY
jgi:hypothetical protein